MADGDRQIVAGWVVREEHRLAWNQGVSEPSLKLVVCGEIGHVRWLLYLVAARQIAKADLEQRVAQFAQRVGVEYGSTQRRHEAPDNDHNAHNAGGPS